MKALRSSARCEATPTWNWCTGFTRSCSCTDSDLHRIIKHFNLDPSRLAKDITESLDRLPRGSTSISDLSSHVEEAVERGWVYGTLMFGESQVRTGYLVVGMLKTRDSRNALHGISKEFEKIKLDDADRSL